MSFLLDLHSLPLQLLYALLQLTYRVLIDVLCVGVWFLVFQFSLDFFDFLLLDYVIFM